MKHRSDIDGLRAVAVIAVILYHFNDKAFPSGFLGVDVFFAISGFVITASLFSLPHDRGFWAFLIEFYNKRVRRIIPALALSSVFASVMMSLFYFTPELSLRSALAAQFGLSNLYFIKNSADYFVDSPTFNAFLHTWSLGVEEQFYFIYPAIIWLAFLGRKTIVGDHLIASAKSTGDRLAEVRVSVVVTILSSLSILSFYLFVVWHYSAPSWSFFSMPARFWELASGALCFFWLRSKQFRHLRPRSVIVGLSLLVLLCVIIFMPQDFLLFTTPISIMCTCALLISQPANPMSQIALNNRVSVYAGYISYSLYLYHWPVIILAKLTVGISLQTFFPLITLIVVLSALSYHFVELPLRMKVWSSRPIVTIVLGVGVAVVTSVLIYLLLSPFKNSLYLGGIPKLEQMNVQSLTTPYEFKGGKWKGQPCILSPFDYLDKEILPQECTLGNLATAQHRALVIGNSFSAAFVRGFDELIEKDHFAVTITSSWGASVVPNVPNFSEYATTSKIYWSKIVPDLLTGLRSGDWVVMINDVNEFYTSDRTPTSVEQENLQLLKSGLAELSTHLSLRGIRIAFLGGLPLARDANCAPDQTILTWYNSYQGGRCVFYTKEHTRMRLSALDHTLKALERDGMIRVIDLFELFCPGETCTYTSKSGEMLFRDRYSHPSVEAVKMSAPIIRKILTGP